MHQFRRGGGQWRGLGWPMAVMMAGENAGLGSAIRELRAASARVARQKKVCAGVSLQGGGGATQVFISKIF